MMNQLTPTYFVAPQIDPADVSQIAAHGITTVICNRPDMEIPPSHHAAVMRNAVEAAGMTFVDLPLSHQTMTPQNIDLHHQAIAASEGPVLAYCASGTRSSVVWALGAVADMSVDEVLAAVRSGGYDLDALRPTLEVAKDVLAKRANQN